MTIGELRQGRIDHALTSNFEGIGLGLPIPLLGPWLVEPTLALCQSARVEWIEEAGHFVQHEEPARVNELLLAHLAA